jgi:large subunit ribosomal protein L24
MPQGGVVELPRPVAVSKIMLICPKCKKATRVGIEVNKNKKSRVCKKCKSTL